MTERDPDAEFGDEGEARRREPSLPADEEAAWAAIVAAYGEEPEDPEIDDGPGEDGGPDGRSHRLRKEDGRSGDGTEGPDGAGRPASGPDGPDGADSTDGSDGTDGTGRGGRGGASDSGTPVRSFTVYAAGTGPRDWDGPADEDEEDEGHFVPPEPPPLPQADTTTKFAWLAVLGGPLLMLGAILFQVELEWWIVTLGVGGFLGGFGTLVARMRDGNDDDWDDPGRGAVV